jgi:hypothetical protein
MEKLRYRRFCKQTWSDAKLVKGIKEKFLTKEQHRELHKVKDEATRRSKVVIVFGNWCRSTQMRGTRPCPGKGLRQMLAKQFAILTIWEGYTSKLYHRTNQPLSPVFLRDPRNPDHPARKLDEVVTLPGDPCHHRSFVNRDVNAARNIHSFAKCWVRSESRPACFSPPRWPRPQGCRSMNPSRGPLLPSCLREPRCERCSHHPLPHDVLASFTDPSCLFLSTPQVKYFSFFCWTLSPDL